MKIRKEIFNTAFPLDEELIKLCEGRDDHRFLCNPASQAIYIYLVNYVLAMSECWFKKLPSELKILDWGAGKGHISYLLKKRNANFESCDILSNSRDSSFGQETPIIKEENISITPLEHDYILPYESETFDIVLSFGVLEHVKNDLASLKEINRILRANGLVFCFFLPYKFSWTQKVDRLKGSSYHDRLYTSQTIKRLLNNSNFSILDIWHRALLPKNTINYPSYNLFEKTDNFLCRNTFLKHFATNIEFVAYKQ